MLTTFRRDHLFGHRYYKMNVDPSTSRYLDSFFVVDDFGNAVAVTVNHLIFVGFQFNTQNH